MDHEICLPERAGDTSEALFAALRDALGVAAVLTGNDIPTRNEQDWSTLGPQRPLRRARQPRNNPLWRVQPRLRPRPRLSKLHRLKRPLSPRRLSLPSGRRLLKPHSQPRLPRHPKPLPRLRSNPLAMRSLVVEYRLYLFTRAISLGVFILVKRNSVLSYTALYPSHS